MALSGNDRSKQGSDDLHLDELFSSHEEQRHVGRFVNNIDMSANAQNVTK
ncbi:uncharacterized protein FRV6_06366 [Fusarium oxysporum]|uniref:Uncharacterized protein n=1 Tax=Fusarium oxysporum TaxID=5507 RepID=A0A2H3TK35_FUSOX|nr:uncharacterized protein FRV6_06366 [Fusarium oxysporum]